jgi:hypothetical protein
VRGVDRTDDERACRFADALDAALSEVGFGYIHVRAVGAYGTEDFVSLAYLTPRDMPRPDHASERAAIARVYAMASAAVG